MISLLLLEDTHDIGDSITDYLTACNFKVDWVQTITQAQDMLKNNKYNCAILDWMLPDGSGAELCQTIKQTTKIPVILVTAKSQLDDKVEWFSSWADDYLPKPFDLKELELRINAVLKRNVNVDIFRWHDISINFTTSEVSKSSEIISLSHTELLILDMLFEARGSVVTRSALLEEIWWAEALRWNDNKLDVYISMIRKKLDKWIIETIKWFGYKLWV